MSVETKIADVKKLVDDLREKSTSAQDFMSALVSLLHERMLKYNWVGFYMIEDPAAGQNATLGLGHFKGAMTPHTRISMNQGICGAAASSGKTIIVDDVSKDPRYLACSLETKSEIVVPVFVRGRIVGELDIDSHFPAAFKAEDQELVEYCAKLTGKFLEQTKA